MGAGFVVCVSVDAEVWEACWEEKGDDAGLCDDEEERSGGGRWMEGICWRREWTAGIVARREAVGSCVGEERWEAGRKEGVWGDFV